MEQEAGDHLVNINERFHCSDDEELAIVFKTDTVELDSVVVSSHEHRPSLCCRRLSVRCANDHVGFHTQHHQEVAGKNSELVCADAPCST